MTLRPAVSPFLLLVLVLWLALVSAPAFAVTTCISNGTGGGLWGSASTWTNCGGGIPANNDSVLIKAGDTVTLNVNSAILRDVTIEGGGLLQGDGTGKILTAGRTGGTNIVNDSIIDFTGTHYAIFKLASGSTWGGVGQYDLSVIDLNTKNLAFETGTTVTLDLSDPDPIRNPGTIACLSTITWNFNGTTAQTLPTTSAICYGAIQINNPAGVTLGTNLTTTNLLGDVQVQSGVLNDGGFTITGQAGSTFSVSNGATFNVTSSFPTGFGTYTFGQTQPSCSTVNYGGANQTISLQNYGNLTLSGSGTKTLPGSAMTVACNFTMAGTASATAAQALTVGGNFSISTAGATFSAGSFSHQLRGNFSRTGTFNGNTSTFTFNGTAAQSVTGATTFNNLTLNNANGLTLNNDVTAAGVLTFTNGKITTGASKMIIGTAGSHTGAAASRYVFGTMEKAGPVGTFTFAIGDATNYTPATTQFTSGGLTGSLAARTTASEHPNIGTSTLDPAKSVNRYWTLTSTGLSGTYNATFNFISPGDVDSASDYTAYTIQRYSGGAWSTTTLGAQNSTNTSATGLTGFGEFAIAVPVGGVDHYLIGHDGSMVTCLSESITFTAHNPGHVAHNPAALTNLAITTSTGKGTWVGVASGTGSISDPTPGNANNGDVTYQFPGGESTVTLTFRYTNPAADPELVNFNVTDSNGKTEATGTAAVDGDDANLSVASTGFVFYNSTDANATFPTQIAAKRSDQGFGAKNLALRAVKSSDSDPSVCAALFANGADVAVQLGAECLNSGTCAGASMAVTNNGSTTNISTNNTNNGADTTAYTSRTLRFGTNSTAELHISYPDAGQMQLHARYDLGSPAGTYMKGSSNAFVVRPFGFHVVATGNPAATNQNGTVYTQAGQDFTVSVTAKGWQGGDDANNDGIPDGHAQADTDPTNNANLSDNTTLNNFGQESGGGEDLALSAVLDLPAGGNDPGLAGGTSITTFANGAGSTSTARYGEVGIIEISAVVSDGDYLSIGGALTDLARSKSGRVGRFTPFDFNVTGNTPVFAPGCDADTTDFTYLTQPFNYATAPQVTLTARNKQGATTVNYDGVWWKLGNFTVTYTHDGGALPGGSTLDVAAASHTAVDCSGGTCDGVFTSTFAGPFTYTRTVTPAAPFTSLVDMTLGNVTDSDGVSYASNPFKFDNVGFGPGANGQRWGRLVIGQAVGDPALALDVPVSAEYYDGTGFVQNADDDCTSFTLATDVSLTNEESGTLPGDQTMTIGAGTTSVTSGDGALADGMDIMTFSAPGAGSTGIVDISLDLDTGTGADLPWLQFDWNGEGMFETTTQGRATFGILSRPENVIYTREPW